MTDRSRWTRKDYAERLDQANADRTALKDELREMTEKANAPIPDPEARAIVECAKSLDKLNTLEKNSRQASYGSTFTAMSSYPSGARYSQPGPVGQVARVLEYLRLRYGLPDPSAELRHVASLLVAAQEERDVAQRRLSEIEATVTGRPTSGFSS